MATEFVVPELGENVEKADVGKVLVAVGDVIAKDQPVVELETDKATVEVPSSVAGKITEIRIKQGEKVKVGQVVLVVEGNGAAESSSIRSLLLALGWSPPMRYRTPTSCASPPFSMEKPFRTGRHRI